jgi:putative ABC transport system substrate-binding protein
VTFFTSPLMAKRLELLRELAPKTDTVAVLVNRDSSASRLEGTNAQAAARSIGVQARVLTATSGDDIDDAFSTIVRDRFSALLVSADPLFFTYRDKLVALAARHRCRQALLIMSMPMLVGCSAMERAARMPIVKPAAISGGY